MANNYSDMTGVLVLGKVTQVIKALFGSFALDAGYPGDGEAYIAEISESNSGDWDEIVEALEALVPEDSGSEGAEEDEDESTEIEGALTALARRFGKEEEMKAVTLGIDWDCGPVLGDLFEIAQLCDDGHGLKAIKTETSWHSSKPRLFEFGGCGEYISKSLSLARSSSAVIRDGEAMDDALSANDPRACAVAMMNALRLSSIRDDSTREAVAIALAELLREKHPAACPPLRYWAVSGRIPGDDEDTLHVLRAENREAAIQAFEEEILSNETEEARENLFKAHGQLVFINSVVVSDAPIQEA